MASTNPNRQATILDDAYDLIGDKAQMVAILVKEIIAQVIDKHDRQECLVDNGQIITIANQVSDGWEATT